MVKPPSLVDGQKAVKNCLSLTKRKINKSNIPSPQPTGADKYTFSKKERLSSVTQIETLFKEGRSFVVYPFKFIFNPLPKGAPSVLISVPRRNFRHAVDRNRLKRQIREIYRTSAHRPVNPYGTAFAIIYIAKEKINFNSLENKLNLGLERLNNTIKGTDIE